MRRLSSKFSPGGTLHNSSGDASQPNEVKKMRRRKSFGLSKSPMAVSMPFQTRNRTDATQTEQPPLSNPAFSNQQLSQMYARVIQMSSENKINAKNTWNLPLIDHIDSLIEERAESQDESTTNFQKASCALDASVKIYSTRVDDTWTSSYRVLENLTRTGKNTDDESAESKTENKHQKNKTSTSKVEKNLNNITLKKFDMEFDVDPMFHKMTRIFDEGGARGMLLNNLQINPGCQLVFDSMDIPDCGDISPVTQDTKCSMTDITSLRERLSEWMAQRNLVLDDLVRLRITREINELYKTQASLTKLAKANELTDADTAEFKRASQSDISQDQSEVDTGDMSDQNNNEEETMNKESNSDLQHISANLSMLSMANSNRPSTLAAPSITAHQMNPSESNDEKNEEPTEHPDETLINDGRFSVSLQDFDTENDFGDMGDESEDDGQSVVSQLIAAVRDLPIRNDKEGTDIGNEDPNARKITEADYSYFNNEVMNKLQVWAGPQHWKCAMRARPHKPKKLDENEVATSAQTRRKPARTRQLIDFEVPFDRSVLEPPARPASIMLSQTMRKQQAEQPELANVLPTDMQIDVRTFSQLFLAPTHHIPTKAVSIVSTVEETNPAPMYTLYDLCPTQAEVDETGYDLYDDEDDDDGADFDFGVTPSMNTNEFDTTQNKDEDVIGMEGGQLLSATRKVEKIDIKYAKAAKKIDVHKLKHSLWHRIDQARHSEDTESSEEESYTPKDVSFKEVVEDLSNVMPYSVTPPIYFICMLHLANEHNLELYQSGEDSDEQEGRMIDDFQIISQNEYTTS